MKISKLWMAVSAAGFAMLAMTLRAEPWPEYRGADGDGVVKEKILTTWPAEGPKKLWTVPTATGFSSFSVSDGRASTLVTRSVDGTLSEVPGAARRIRERALGDIDRRGEVSWRRRQRRQG